MRDWKKYTSDTLQELGIRSSKSKGQNFLIRYGIVIRMVKEVNIVPNDHVLEIGGGIGILTHELIKTKAKITVIENDKKLANYLKNTYNNIDVIGGDALKVKWPSSVRVVANLPYSISTPLLDRILHHSIQDAIVMLQKEVALRCIAKPGSKNYSRLSVLCNIHSDIKKIVDIPPEAFYPKPKVDSQILYFMKKTSSISLNHANVELLTRNLFSLKRRTLRTVIRGFLKRKNHSIEIWDKVPYNNKRIFELSPAMIDEVLLYLQENDAWPLA